MCFLRFFSVAIDIYHYRKWWASMALPLPACSMDRIASNLFHKASKSLQMAYSHLWCSQMLRWAPWCNVRSCSQRVLAVAGMSAR